MIINNTLIIYKFSFTGGENIDTKQIGGILSVILGLIFIIFPIFSTTLVSVIVGLSLLFFGIICAVMGWEMRNSFNLFSNITIVLGIIAIIFGFLFLFYIDALSFLVGLQCYLVGIIMVLFGIVGLFSGLSLISKPSAIVTLIMGILAICVAIFAQSNPIYVAIIIGVCLILKGIFLFLTD